MPRRTDNIHKRKDGRWEGRYQKGRKNNGNILYGSVYGKTYKETLNKLKKVKNNNIEMQLSPTTNYITFGELLDKWLRFNAHRLKGSTIYKYYRLIETHIKPTLSNILLSELNNDLLIKFVQDKINHGSLLSNNKLSNSYVKTIILIINSAIKYARREEQLNISPIEIKISKKNSSLMQLLGNEHQLKLEKYIIENPTPINTGIMISLYTGLRIGEICSLLWKNINLIDKVIYVESTIAKTYNLEKNKVEIIIDYAKTITSQRCIPINNKLYNFLTSLPPYSDNIFVCSNTKENISVRTFQYQFHKVLKECNIPSLNFHAIRHTFATNCIKSGVDVKSLSEILGHANVSTTLKLYVHSSIDMKREQLQKLDTLFINKKK